MVNGRPERIAIENVLSPGRQVSVDAAKYHDMRAAVLTVLVPARPAITPAELMELVVPLLSPELFPGGDKAGWWLKAVQLDLEAKGILCREASKPVRLSRSAVPG